jgi:hypothetical protein
MVKDFSSFAQGDSWEQLILSWLQSEVPGAKKLFDFIGPTL